MRHQAFSGSSLSCVSVSYMELHTLSPSFPPQFLRLVRCQPPHTVQVRLLASTAGLVFELGLKTFSSQTATLVQM